MSLLQIFEELAEDCFDTCEANIDCVIETFSSSDDSLKIRSNISNNNIFGDMVLVNSFADTVKSPVFS